MLQDFIQISATETERENILECLCIVFGVKNTWQILCQFSYFKEIMKALGYKYTGCDYKNESHNFKNGSFEVSVFPVCFYEKQGVFRLHNLQIMWI